MFAFSVITFEPIKILNCLAPQNDSLNLSFVKDIKCLEMVEKQQMVRGVGAVTNKQWSSHLFSWVSLDGWHYEKYLLKSFDLYPFSMKSTRNNIHLLFCHNSIFRDMVCSQWFIFKNPIWKMTSFMNQNESNQNIFQNKWQSKSSTCLFDELFFTSKPFVIFTNLWWFFGDLDTWKVIPNS